MTWKSEWAKCLRSPEDLIRAGLMTTAEASACRPIFERFPVAIPLYYAGLIDPRDPSCPIRRQALPHLNEQKEGPGFVPDPLGDTRHRPVSRITHRYSNRLLLHLTPNCSMTCRYCFRKSLLNELKDEMFSGELEESFKYIENHPEVSEVILSGGDPLMVDDSLIEGVMERLDRMEHLTTVRIHTRTPVTFPMRVDERFVEAFSAFRRAKVLVFHFNHPREVTAETRRVVEELKRVGVTLLNQAVLLDGVNDSSGTLIELSKKLFEVGILPYYLHHPDPAVGTTHFYVPVDVGLKIYNEMRASLPGYLVPKYVVDRPEVPYKMAVVEFAQY